MRRFIHHLSEVDFIKELLSVWFTKHMQARSLSLSSVISGTKDTTDAVRHIILSNDEKLFRSFQTDFFASLS